MRIVRTAAASTLQQKPSRESHEQASFWHMSHVAASCCKHSSQEWRLHRGVGPGDSCLAVFKSIQEHTDWFQSILTGFSD